MADERLVSLLNTELKRFFGYDRLRERQIPLACKIASGEDCLGLMQTSGGKSICFQLPALIDDGITVVISPLLSLIDDQVRELKDRQLPAEKIVGSTPFHERQRIMQAIYKKQLKLLYVSPELFAKGSFAQQFNERAPIKRVVFDESHCISAWGEDFRPGYYNAVKMVKKLQAVYKQHQLPKLQIVAVTASATPEVQSNICKLLDISSHNVTAESVARDNLLFNVITTTDKSDRKKHVLNLLNEHSGEPVVIYANSRKTVNELASFLTANRFDAKPYHAGLNQTVREQRQADFLADKLPIMVATTAFGMGVNKPNIRAVIHYECPRTIEDYYQQAGRAGRDNDDAYCYLLFNGKQEFSALNHMLAYSHPNSEDTKATYGFLLALQQQYPGQPVEYSASMLAKALDLSEPKIKWIVNFFERQRIIYASDQGFNIRTLKSANWALIDKILNHRTAKANAMLAYARSQQCRQWVIKHYFGEPEKYHCGQCDNCRASSSGKERGDRTSALLRSELSAAVNSIAQGMRIPPSAIISPMALRQLAENPPTSVAGLRAMTRMTEITFDLKATPLIRAFARAGRSLDNGKSPDVGSPAYPSASLRDDDGLADHLVD